jgi:DNA repair protein RadC
MTIQNTPLLERPRERCLETGPNCLSLRECLAVILGSGPPGIGCLGLAAHIIQKPGPGLAPSDEERAFFTAMENSGLTYLKEIDGLGPAGQSRILAAFELGRRYALFRHQGKKTDFKKLSFSNITFEALGKITQNQRNEPHEWLGFVPLHRSGNLGEFSLVERGVRTHVNTDPAELFARVLVLRPRGFILFHNHPSGNVTPSSQDLDLTTKVYEISKQFGIQLLGHWVVTSSGEQWIDPRD